MRHHFYSSDELRTIGIIAILLYIVLLFIIAAMWMHIERQDETIRNLRMKISKMECRQMTEKAVIHSMCLHELFDKIDHKEIIISILIFSEIISVSEKSLFTRLHFKTIRNNSHFGSFVFLTIFTQRFSSTAINTK